MLNRSTIMGRITADPELRKAPSGASVTSFTIACERDFSNDGNRETDFIDIVAWRNTAEFVAKYFKKGSMVCVDGRLQMRTWKDKDGNNRRNAEILSNSVYFGSAKVNEAPEVKPVISENQENIENFKVIEEDDSLLPF